MNLFWKKLFGGMPSTAKLEKTESELLSAMRRYEEVDKSLELAEYKSLYHEVKSSAFIETKKTLQNRKYKDTEEYKIASKVNKLMNSPSIKAYYQVLESAELKEYLSFKATPEFEDLGDKQKVKESAKLTKLKHFEHSNALKTYMRYHNSYIIKEYEELRTKAATAEFKQANEFWANNHRWQTTAEHEKEQRFYELAKNPDIAFYNNEKPERFRKLQELTLTFDEEFSWNTLDKSRWNFGFKYGSDKLIGNHSFANEKQANNAGKNISVTNGILKITTRHEKVIAPAWHTSKGFIDREFAYTSDVLQTADEFRQKGGLFKAKLRCTGKINHAFWLAANGKLPHINIFHYDGKKIRVGNATASIVDGIEITGINPSEYFIYGLRWTDKELVWTINDVEVYRTASNIPKEEMFLVFNSFIPKKMHGDTGHLDVDWVRVYKL